MCRHSTGSLGTWFAALKGRPSDNSMANVAAYNATEIATRYFCKTCGCNVFVCMQKEGRWIACAGIVELEFEHTSTGGQTGSEANVGIHDENHMWKQDRYGKEDRNLSRIMYHEYLGGVKDGGLAPYLMRLGGRNIPSYVNEPTEEETPLEPRRVLDMRADAEVSTTTRGNVLKAACLCGGVELRIAPPAYDANSEGWFVTKDKTKYYARLCNCRSCRLTLGFTFQPWTYIPPSQIFTANGERLVVGPKAKATKQIEKLQYYQSSESVLRAFCNTCGATMFYQSFDRPYIINVSVGVVRSTFGNAMLREWLEWDRKVVSKREEAVDEEMIEAWLREE